MNEYDIRATYYSQSDRRARIPAQRCPAMVLRRDGGKETCNFPLRPGSRICPHCRGYVSACPPTPASAGSAAAADIYPQTMRIIFRGDPGGAAPAAAQAADPGRGGGSDRAASSRGRGRSPDRHSGSSRAPSAFRSAVGAGMIQGARGFAVEPISDLTPSCLEYFGAALVVFAIVGILVWCVMQYKRRRNTREADDTVPLVRDEEAPPPRTATIVPDPSRSMMPPLSFERTREEEEAQARRLSRA